VWESAVNAVNHLIAPKMLGLDCSVQSRVDEALLGICEDAKTVLGGNAIAAVSAAALKAGRAAWGYLYISISAANVRSRCLFRA
jgi:enolase